MDSKARKVSHKTEIEEERTNRGVIILIRERTPLYEGLIVRYHCGGCTVTRPDGKFRHLDRMLLDQSVRLTK